MHMQFCDSVCASIMLGQPRWHLPVYVCQSWFLLASHTVTSRLLVCILSHHTPVGGCTHVHCVHCGLFSVHHLRIVWFRSAIDALLLFTLHRSTPWEKKLINTSMFKVLYLKVSSTQKTKQNKKNKNKTKTKLNSTKTTILFSSKVGIQVDNSRKKNNDVQEMLDSAIIVTSFLVCIWSHHTPVDMIGDITVTSLWSIFMCVRVFESFFERAITVTALIKSSLITPHSCRHAS